MLSEVSCAFDMFCRIHTGVSLSRAASEYTSGCLERGGFGKKGANVMEPLLWHAREDIAQVWKDALFFYLEHRGMFANALLVGPTLPPPVAVALGRELELQGFFFRSLGMQAQASDDFLPWLWGEVCETGGAVHDLSRVALLVPICGQFVLPGGRGLRAAWARQIPCPVIFQISPQEDWRGWWREHRVLFGGMPSVFLAEGTFALAALNADLNAEGEVW